MCKIACFHDIIFGGGDIITHLSISMYLLYPYIPYTMDTRPRREPSLLEHLKYIILGPHFDHFRINYFGSHSHHIPRLYEYDITLSTYPQETQKGPKKGLKRG